MKTLPILALAGLLLAGTAFAQPYPGPAPYGAPPAYAPIPAEPAYIAPPPPPGPPERYVLERAHWHWDGRAYVWVPGHWVVRQVGFHEYIGGHWAPRHGAWIWIPAHWR